jgi:hypothetical protein
MKKKEDEAKVSHGIKHKGMYIFYNITIFVLPKLPRSQYFPFFGW